MYIAGGGPGTGPHLLKSKAMRVIFRQPYDCPTNTLLDLSGLPRVSDRLRALTTDYLTAALATSNPMIIALELVLGNNGP